MQDRYAGDIGDYGKYGLLRWLCRADGHGAAFRLGIRWYLFDGGEPDAPNDGRHIQYLSNPTPVEKLLRDCDPELYDELKKLVLNGMRCIDTIEHGGILPSDTLFHSTPLKFDNAPQKEAKRAMRQEWTEAGLAAVEESEVVFVDPDNGLEIPSTGRFGKKGPKFVYYDDLLPCWERGQSLIIYHHANRKKLSYEVAQRCTELRHELSGAKPVALRFRRRSPRVYFVLAQPHHEKRLNARVQSFLDSDWGKGNPPHFERVAS